MKGFKKSRTLQAFIGIVFFVSGVIINGLQLLLWWTVKPLNIHLYRKLNYYLIYSLYAQVVALAEYWSGSSCTLYLEDEEVLNLLGKEHGLCIMNHKYEVDWLMSWIVADKFRCLGASKSMAKKSLKWVPVIGWTWKFAEMVFLHRNWEKDEKVMSDSLQQLFEYDDKILLLVFSEGTRFTEEKHQGSLEFARERGLPELKYHLYPRPKGFVYTVKKIQELYPKCVFYNMELAFPEGPNDTAPTFSSVIKGRPIKGDLYISRIPITDIPSSTDEELRAFLYDLYKKKDDLMEYYQKNGRFPGKAHPLPRRKATVLNWLLWFIPISTLALYTIGFLLLSNNRYLFSLGVAIVVFGFGMLYFFNRITKSTKGSKYGLQGKSDKSSGKSSPKSSDDENIRGDPPGSRSIPSLSSNDDPSLRKRIAGGGGEIDDRSPNGQVQS